MKNAAFVEYQVCKGIIDSVRTLFFYFCLKNALFVFFALNIDLPANKNSIVGV